MKLRLDIKLKLLRLYDIAEKVAKKINGTSRETTNRPMFI